MNYIIESGFSKNVSKLNRTSVYFERDAPTPESHKYSNKNLRRITTKIIPWRTDIYAHVLLTYIKKNFTYIGPYRWPEDSIGYLPIRLYFCILFPSH